MDAIIKVRDLYFQRNDHVVFNGIDLDIQQGSITAIMGPSGTGKTTLLRMIGGQLSPDSGRVLVDGKNIPGLTRKELFRVRRDMGMLFQSGALFSDMTVYENVAFPLRVHTELPDSFIRDLVLMKLQAVGLRGARDLMPSQLSGGMARRAALARAIALDPKIIMYDEPFAGQDPVSMGMLLTLVKRLNESMGLTSVVVSHDVRETAQIADKIYILSEGSIIAHDTPQALFANKEPRVQQFMNGLPDGPVPFHYPAASLQSDFGY
jgi:phospholipid/cholesterol/gamma-HCH transport system ATP-binding protein